MLELMEGEHEDTCNQIRIALISFPFLSFLTSVWQTDLPAESVTGDIDFRNHTNAAIESILLKRKKHQKKRISNDNDTE